MAAMAAVVASLTKILVGNNQLGDEGTTVLCDALRKSKVTGVQELELYRNGIGPGGANAVVAMVAVVASMTRLGVSNNNLGEVGKAALLTAREGRSGLELLL